MTIPMTSSTRESHSRPSFLSQQWRRLREFLKTPHFGRHGTALLILLLLLAATLSGGFATRQVVKDEEGRALGQRVIELAGYLSSAITNLQSPLKTVGIVAAA